MHVFIMAYNIYMVMLYCVGFSFMHNCYCSPIDNWKLLQGLYQILPRCLYTEQFVLSFLFYPPLLIFPKNILIQLYMWWFGQWMPQALVSVLPAIVWFLLYALVLQGQEFLLDWFAASYQVYLLWIISSLWTRTSPLLLG